MYWAVISAPVPFGRALDRLARNELARVRSEPEQATAEFRAPDGTYAFPIAGRLFWGSKQGHTSAPSFDTGGSPR